MPTALSQFMSGLTLKINQIDDDNNSCGPEEVRTTSSSTTKPKTTTKMIIVVDNARKHMVTAAGRASTGKLLPVITEDSSCWPQAYRHDDMLSSTKAPKRNGGRGRWSGGCSPMQTFTKGKAAAKYASSSTSSTTTTKKLHDRHGLIQPQRRESDPVVINQLFQNFMAEYDYEDSSSEFEAPVPAAPRKKTIKPASQRAQSLDSVLLEALCACEETTANASALLSPPTPSSRTTLQ